MTRRVAVVAVLVRLAPEVCAHLRVKRARRNRLLQIADQPCRRGTSRGTDGGTQVDVRRAHWDQFDVSAAAWVKPADATKTAKPRRVPL